MPHGHALADALRDLGLGALVAPPLRAASSTAAATRSRSRGRDGKVAGVRARAGGAMRRGRGLPGFEGRRHRRVVVRVGGLSRAAVPGALSRSRLSRSVIIANGSRLEPVSAAPFPARNTMPRPDPAPADPAAAPDTPSKTRRKQAMHALQDLGEALVALDAKRLAELGLPERLADAITTGARHPRARGPPPPDPVHRQADARHRSRTRAADAASAGPRARPTITRGSPRPSTGATNCWPTTRRSTGSRKPIRRPTAPRLPRWCAMRGSSERAADRRIAIARCSAR